MPTPFDLLRDPISLAVFGIYAILIVWEAIAPAKRLPNAPMWRTRGLIAFGVYFLLSSYLPLFWGEYFSSLQLIDLTALGTWGGALAGLLVYEFGAYVYHRSVHSSTLLWRGLHQMHHSAERVDSYGAFWFSPLDAVGWTALSSLCLTLIVGITPAATVITMLTVTLLAVFQHCNIRTPQWLGYIVQRPESHSHHHARGVHANNYSDLPLFDLIFGTFVNPPDFAEANGFYDGASQRIGDMLLFRDVSQPRQSNSTSVVANRT
jgi:sterol desaturase/sphingolipid hydroxylase (fatty acid hydroxylase superfamily)